MKVTTRPNASGELADPASAAWGGVPSEVVKLAPVDLAKQPTAYIREAWQHRAYGTTPSVAVAVATDGDGLFVRMEWADDPEANGEFQDAAGVMFPAAAGSPAATMGSADKAVGIWFWEQGREAPLDLLSHGPGVVRKTGTNIAASARLADGKWSVVLRGPASAAKLGEVGFAVWNGSRGERGGLGSVSQQWLPIEKA
jgi:DMSO reductase family type II enzyme heme b subunit